MTHKYNINDNLYIRIKDGVCKCKITKLCDKKYKNIWDGYWYPSYKINVYAKIEHDKEINLEQSIVYIVPECLLFQEGEWIDYIWTMKK